MDQPTDQDRAPAPLGMVSEGRTTWGVKKKTKTNHVIHQSREQSTAEQSKAAEWRHHVWSMLLHLELLSLGKSSGWR